MKQSAVYMMANKPNGTAISREKQIKAGSRQKKIKLIEVKNSAWTDLYPQITGVPTSKL